MKSKCTFSSTVYVMCGYGVVNVNIRTVKEIQGLGGYMALCVRYIVNDPNARLLILCGGKTDSRVDISEAASMLPNVKELFKRYGCPFPVNRILLSEQSQNTAQNIFDAFRLIGGQSSKPDRVIVFCDTFRTAKAGVIVDYLLRQPEFSNLVQPFPLAEPRAIQVIGFSRLDVHPNSCWPVQLGEALRYAGNPDLIEAPIKDR